MTERCQRDGNIFMSSCSYLANCRCHTGKALKGNYFFSRTGRQKREFDWRWIFQRSDPNVWTWTWYIRYLPCLPRDRTGREIKNSKWESSRTSVSRTQKLETCVSVPLPWRQWIRFFLLQCKSTLDTHLGLSYFWQQKNRDFPPGNRGNWGGKCDLLTSAKRRRRNYSTW